MSDDDFTPIFIFIVVFIALVAGFLSGLLFGTGKAQKETEQKIVVYCVEQPSACKVKYDYYKLENQK